MVAVLSRYFHSRKKRRLLAMSSKEAILFYWDQFQLWTGLRKRELLEEPEIILPPVSSHFCNSSNIWARSSKKVPSNMRRMCIFRSSCPRYRPCHWLASVAQLDVPSDWRPGGRGFNPRRGRQHSFVEIDHEIFSTVILSLPLIQEGQLSVSGERMCTILVNRLED